MFNDILLPLDLGDEEESSFLLSEAADLCRQMGARLHVMTIVPVFQMPMVASFFPEDFEKKALEEGEEALKTFVGNSPAAAAVAQHIVGHGSVYKEIVRFAKETQCDLILIGPGTSKSGDFLLGHNATRVMRHAHCSVLLRRH